MAKFETLLRNFWKKIRCGEPDECWPWLGNTNDQGYGRLKWSAHGQNLAHRRALELSGTPIPDGLIVLHTCDNPPCCNPRHLRLGTKTINAADRDSKGRARGGGARLSATAVVEIRQSTESSQVLAKKYGVSQSSIYRVRDNTFWRHVP